MINARVPGSIFISGAARGIGRATAELFLARGWRVGMFDVDAHAVAEAAEERAAAVHSSLDIRDADQGGEPSARSAGTADSTCW